MTGTLDAVTGEEVSAQDAWRRLHDDPRARIVDVRTDAEWSYVGEPDLGDMADRYLRLSWQTYPGLVRNPSFDSDLVRLAARESPLFFICRSGGRSLAAARSASALGFQHAYSIRDGFEGPPDADGHRGRVAGWKQVGLPWTQT